MSGDPPSRAELAREEAEEALADAQRTGDYSRFACRECGYVPRNRDEVMASNCPQCGATGSDR
jgi:rubrerythrin